eukprot:CAMPEP_0196187172 /NCGR_PEP_ID=MMETSP0911-20130528/39843_1 /TAXON_ID=49265 /ORGANISM="Thalassiosira rotula, Strain GSO102" /LENGTH=80 /DNA_ID=CAMNT_0041458183 /DNA_START=55 /DNA_END=297 /DNA_ORIENTATION=-
MVNSSQLHCIDGICRTLTGAAAASMAIQNVEGVDPDSMVINIQDQITAKVTSFKCEEKEFDAVAAVLSDATSGLHLSYKN